uniref:Disease resistance R13L4/SHOC-2-like LRR domain-containing protein n=1 Tax=Oryza brachyantha TaxID=4533 RepID=J3NCX1_ORYBR
MEVSFAQGAMQKLRILSLSFGVGKTTDIFGDFDFGLENLSSLEHANVLIQHSYSRSKEADDAAMAIERSLQLNPKIRMLKLKKI